MTNSNSCTSSFVQRAGLAALTGPQSEVDAMISEFRVRRDEMVRGLNAIPGMKCFQPHGAFYVFPNIHGTGISSAELAKALLEQAGVACLSGTSFGAHGEGYLRFSYANSLANIRTALHSVSEFLSVRVK
jgi:aspartate/methionine/tyrosine aminotransferase